MSVIRRAMATAPSNVGVAEPEKAGGNELRFAGAEQGGGSARRR